MVNNIKLFVDITPPSNYSALYHTRHMHEGNFFYEMRSLGNIKPNLHRTPKFITEKKPLK